MVLPQTWRMANSLGLRPKTFAMVSRRLSLSRVSEFYEGRLLFSPVGVLIQKNLLMLYKVSFREMKGTKDFLSLVIIHLLIFAMLTNEFTSVFL